MLRVKSYLYRWWWTDEEEKRQEIECIHPAIVRVVYVCN